MKMGWVRWIYLNSYCHDCERDGQFISCFIDFDKKDWLQLFFCRRCGKADFLLQGVNKRNSALSNKYKTLFERLFRIKIVRNEKDIRSFKLVGN